MNYFNYKTSQILFITLLTISNVACAKNISDECNSNNVGKSLNCIAKQNEKLKNQLNQKNNAKKGDFNIWIKSVEKKCEGKKNYTLGEGAALIREECYKNEYINRLQVISKEETELPKNKNINDDGFVITSLPYHSDDHINCLMSANKNSCSKVNLIEVNKLSKVYNFLDVSNGASVVFPQTENGVTVIAQPSSSESGEPMINLVSVNALGLTKKLSLDASKNIVIDKNFRISFLKNGKLKNIIMGSNGDFGQ